MPNTPRSIIIAIASLLFACDAPEPPEPEYTVIVDTKIQQTGDFMAPDAHQQEWAENNGATWEHDTLLRDIWAETRDNYFTDRTNPTTTPKNLANAQQNLYPFLEGAFLIGDLALIGEVCAIINRSEASLLLVEELPIAMGGFDEIVEYDPPGRRMWINPRTPGTGRESHLDSVQWLTVVARAIRIVSQIDPGDRTTDMDDLMINMVPVVTDHLDRWVLEEGTLQLRGAGCRDGRYNWLDHALLTYRFENDQKCEECYSCNAWRDKDIMIMTVVAEMWPLLPNQDDYRKFLRIGYDALRKRSSVTTGLVNFDTGAGGIEGMDFDFGIWRDHPDHAYTGYVLEDPFPTGSDEGAVPVGQDIGHTLRFTHHFKAMYQNRAALQRDSFPTDTDMARLASQWAFKIYNGDLTYPRFSAFFDGSEGWYRVSQTTGNASAGPGMLSSAAFVGYGHLSTWIPEVRLIGDALWDMADSAVPAVVAHRERYFEGTWRNREIDITPRYDQSDSLDLLSHLATLINYPA